MPASAERERPVNLQRVTRATAPCDTDALARFLIGEILVRRLDADRFVAGRIVETEAYAPGDPASHAFRGPTKRNASMFAERLHAYVYFIYGSAYCLNVSSETQGIGAAVLLRALEPLDGIEFMRARRGPAVADRDLLRGPGRLCAAFGIDSQLDGADLESDARLWLATDGLRKPAVGVSTRIGLTKAIDFPQRFYARASAYVSGRRELSPDV